MTTVQNNTVSQSLLDTMNGVKKNTADSISEAQDRFMTLLVTQMKNQDPLNPLDNAQVTSQLAQLSTVTGINQLNETLGNIMTQFQSGQVLQASNMIGHVVMLEGNHVALTEGNALFGLDLISTADEVKVSIQDGAGNTVRDLTLGRQTAGIKTFTWDGYNNEGVAAPDGNYTFTVNAKVSGNTVASKRYSFDSVNSVSTSAANGVQLKLSSMGEVGLSAVKEIY
jgi:flagellar basal-body rod modification protein FlgD